MKRLIATLVLVAPCTVSGDFVVKCDFVVDTSPFAIQILNASPVGCSYVVQDNPPKAAVKPLNCPRGYLNNGELTWITLGGSNFRQGNFIVERRFREVQRTCVPAETTPKAPTPSQ